MATPKRYFIEDTYYHVFNRGNRKQDIFNQKRDYQRFLDSVMKYKNKTGVGIATYCLMPNHFHFILRQNTPNQIQKFMHYLSTSYSKYYNIKYDLVGSLLQGRYKTKPVENEEHLIYLTAYIHLNPAGRNTDLSDIINYPWSSLSFYVQEEKSELGDLNDILGIFWANDKQNKYKSFIYDQLRSKNFDKISHLLLD